MRYYLRPIVQPVVEVAHPEAVVVCCEHVHLVRVQSDAPHNVAAGAGVAYISIDVDVGVGYIGVGVAAEAGAVGCG